MCCRETGLRIEAGTFSAVSHETAPTGSSLAGMAPPRDEVKDLEYPIVVLFGRSVAETLEHCNELFLRYRS
jgi:hypothetical protein